MANLKNVLSASVLILIFLLVSCKPTIPSEYIQPAALEDILYDYHIAMSIAMQKGNTPSEQKTYKMAVLKKHEVTEQDFEHSLQYYLRHTEKLHKIYENLSLRLEAEARTQGISENDLNQFGSSMAQGDTADVWNKSKSMVLSPFAPRNYEPFVIEADTSFHKGDRLLMNFNSKFIIQDGVRDAVFVVTVVFKNDSISSQSFHISSDSYQSFNLLNAGNSEIKSVRGYFLMLKPEQITSTFKLLILTNIHLIKMHINKSEQNNSDSLSNNESIRTVGGSPVKKNLKLSPSDTSMKLQQPLHKAMKARHINERALP